jgi:hypothetical protein
MLRRSPYRYLWSDSWIAISWLLLIGTGMSSALVRLQSSTPTTVSDLIGSFLCTGYGFWSAYFGLTACWRFAIGRLPGRASSWIANHFRDALRALVWLVSMMVFGWILFVLALMYAVYGGGIYHFARRWWLLAHGQQPPFLRRY